MALDQALSWLDGGLYRFIFTKSVKQAVIDAEHLLTQAKSNGIANSAPADTLATLQSLENALKCVTGVAVELSHSAALVQLLVQLLLMTTVRRMMQCSQLLENVVRSHTNPVDGRRITPPQSPKQLQPPSTPKPPHNQAPQLHTPISGGSAYGEFAGLQFSIPVRVVPWRELALNKPLGQGAYGSVFSAWLKGAQVAVKCLEVLPQEEDVLHPFDQQQQQDLHEEQEQQLLAIMQKEAMVMLANQHPNIVRCLAVCYERPAIIMELCTGGSLYHQVRRYHYLLQIRQQQQWQQQPQKQLFTPLRVLKLLHQVAIAMDFLHSAEEDAAAVAAPGTHGSTGIPASRTGSAGRQPLPPVLHCDLRAPNLLLAGSRPEDWSVKVADFGLAQWAGPDGDTARTDTVTNHLWLAPEVLQKTEADSREQQRQQQGSEPGRYMVSKAADVYSYGCVLLEVLTGRMPFETDSVNRLQLKALAGTCGNPVAAIGRLQWPKPGQLLSGFDSEELQRLKPLFEACTDPDPKQRPTFEQIQCQLAELVKKAAEGAMASRAAAANSSLAAAGPVTPAASVSRLVPAALSTGVFAASEAAPLTPCGQPQQPVQPQLVFMPSLNELAPGSAGAEQAVAAAAAPPSAARQAASKAAQAPLSPNHLYARQESSGPFARFGAAQPPQLVTSYVSPFMMSSRVAQVGETKQ